MHLIQCPHCGEDIELEDGASGMFVCPYCDKDFTWSGGVKVIVVDDDLKSKFLVFLLVYFLPVSFTLSVYGYKLQYSLQVVGMFFFTS